MERFLSNIGTGFAGDAHAAVERPATEPLVPNVHGAAGNPVGRSPTLKNPDVSDLYPHGQFGKPIRQTTIGWRLATKRQALEL
jgi:hypothetical protein